MHRSLAILVLFGCAAHAQWVNVGGSLKHVSAAADGTIWGVNSADAIYRWTSGQWQQIPGQLRQISAGSAQHVWGVNAADMIFKWNGSSWVNIPGLLRQISVGSDGTVWGVNSALTVFRYNPATNGWTGLPVNMRAVAVGNAQEIWGLTPQGGVARWNGSGWDVRPGQLVDLSVGADGTVWGVATGGAVYQWVAAQNTWQQRDGILAQISVGNANTIWGVTASNTIFQRGAVAASTSGTVSVVLGPTTTISGTPTNTSITPVTTTSTNVQATNYSPPAQQTGQLVCVMNLGSATAQCGTRKAEHVGSYSLNMKCDSGFFDPIYGGTCWSCPGDVDGFGAFIRSATSVEANDACWRVPKEHFGRATRVKSTPWAWECSSGTFWDPKGGCYQCPADTPRRTAHPVDHERACASAVNETRTATLLSFNGCPSPDAAKMKSEGKLPGKMMPGKPFLDIAGGWNQGSISGGCYTCPTVDSDGNFLISMRNGNPIYGENQGCTIYENYKPAAFHRPGLSGLGAVKGLLVEKNHLSPAPLLLFLHGLAVANGKTPDSPEARAWVAQELSVMAASPYRNKSFRTLVLALLTDALATPVASRTPSQTALLNSMGAFATGWRTHVAQESLAMYDAWKSWDEKYKPRQSQLNTMFDYGTVPLDFQNIVTSLGAPTAVGAGLAGSIGAAAAFTNSLNWIKSIASDGDVIWKTTNSLYQLLRTGTIFSQAARVAQGVSTALAASAGATVIGIAGAVVTAVASDQFQKIITARPNLEAALAAARIPVTLDQVYTGGDGASKLQYLWIMAMDTEAETEDPQVVQSVNAVIQAGQATGYAAPKGN